MFGPATKPELYPQDEFLMPQSQPLGLFKPGALKFSGLSPLNPVWLGPPSPRGWSAGMFLFLSSLSETLLTWLVYMHVWAIRVFQATFWSRYYTE